ncbi:hypothetical protein HU230_0012470 [Bradyrhizobium quebecense]|uniref:Uncharacterized protein n=1 Tax=Bradyrhizobium quebecense TaxID=2748629 RepID=A0A973WQW2_9BRAD|nr:hypothetical protein [Bradyrhizobium quebecense]UGA46803.1 hypothetical protein HU230_0012470 [Bradyrhizobium quebecense]
MSQDTVIHDTRVTFHDDPMSDKLGFVHTQHIPDDFVAALKREKMDSARRPAGDFLHMCSIPVSVVEDLKRSGYDVYREPVRETIRMLKVVGLDAFITSDKQI